MIPHRAIGTRRAKRLANVDPDALAELRAAAIARRIERGLPLTRVMQGWFYETLAGALVKRGSILALGMHQKILQRGLRGDRLSEMALGQKSADAMLDRALGKPTEHHRVSGVHTIVFTGLDPSKLPDARPKTVDGKPVLPLPRDSTPESQEDEGNG